MSIERNLLAQRVLMLVGVAVVGGIIVTGVLASRGSDVPQNDTPTTVQEIVPTVVVVEVMQVEPTLVVLEVVEQVIGGIGYGGGEGTNVVLEQAGGGTQFVGGGNGVFVTSSKIATCNGGPCNVISVVQNGNLQPPETPHDYPVTALDGTVQIMPGG